jgi:hypothetical protein
VWRCLLVALILGCFAFFVIIRSLEAIALHKSRSRIVSSTSDDAGRGVTTSVVNRPDPRQREEYLKYLMNVTGQSRSAIEELDTKAQRNIGGDGWARTRARRA